MTIQFDESDDLMRTGGIPWDADEFLEILSFEQSLSSTPKDDWDLSPKPLSDSLSLNMFAPMNQLGMYAVQKLKGENGARHLWRFFQIGAFLEKKRTAFNCRWILPVH